MFFFFDPTIVLLIPAVLLAIYAQYKVSSAFKKYSKINTARNITARQAAEEILRANGLSQIRVNRVEGNLSDHYDPRKRQLFLSQPVYSSNSIAALGIAAHEAGHAIQHERGYVPFKLRSAIVPAASLGSSLAFPLFFIGIIFSFPILWKIGIVFFAGAVLFHLVTLPVELDASRRALKSLSQQGLLVDSELDGAKKVLQAAALTYIAAAAMAILNLLRMLILARGRE